MINIASWLTGFAAIMAAATKLYAAIQEFIKVAKPVIDVAEGLALDGKIDKEDRKQIVTQAIDLLVLNKKVTIPWYVKPFLGWIIDSIAKKLPDFQVKTLAQAITNEAAAIVKAPVA